MLTKRHIDMLPLRLLVSHYLMASYCYYQQDCSPMSDEAFDYLCVRIERSYTRIEHPHKGLVDREALTAGTCLLAEKKYPSRVRLGWRQYYASAVNGFLEDELEKLYGVFTATPNRRMRVRPVASAKPAEPATRLKRSRPSQTPEPTPPRKRRARPSGR